MGISTQTWQTIIDDAVIVVQDIDKALTVGAVLGVPEAAVIEPLASLLATVLSKVQSAQKGDLTPLRATIASIDAATDAEAVAKFPGG
jgi:hypothetical protein